LSASLHSTLKLALSHEKPSSKACAQRLSASLHSTQEMMCEWQRIEEVLNAFRHHCIQHYQRTNNSSTDG
ncbi:MAG: hypothetical protein NZU63_15160, partial [Gemmataceae bacterium]|nr:hypothetical protein [Gemmataceae bacterium]MDW8244932.1 hypothetical protein [Thermogemmata sp.]